jgi:hypothetical protein
VNIYFLAAKKPGRAIRQHPMYLKVNSDFTRHVCEKQGALKVYSDGERAEFQRRREAGEI